MFNKSDIEKYFMAEKNATMLFIIIGAAAIIASIVFFFFLKTNFYKGLALPLFLVGVIQLTIGYTVNKRTDDDRKRNVYAYDMNPAQLKQKEVPRMEKVNKNFVIYKWVEIFLVLAGIVLIFLYRANADKSFLYGLGVGLLVQAAICLVADSFAEARAKKYTQGLQQFTQKL